MLHKGRKGKKGGSTKDSKRSQIPIFGSKTSQNPQTSRERTKGEALERKIISHMTEFVKKNTPSVICANSRIEHNQSREEGISRNGDISTINNRGNESRNLVLSNTRPSDDLRPQKFTNEPNHSFPHNFWQHSPAENLDGIPSQEVFSNLHPGNQNNHERLGEVPADDSKRNEASPEPKKEKNKTEDQELTHSLRPTNSAYFPQRDQIFKEWDSKTNYRNNVEYLPSWKRLKNILSQSSPSNLDFILQNQTQSQRSDHYHHHHQHPIQTYKFNF